MISLYITQNVVKKGKVAYNRGNYLEDTLIVNFWTTLLGNASKGCFSDCKPTTRATSALFQSETHPHPLDPNIDLSDTQWLYSH